MTGARNVSYAPIAAIPIGVMNVGYTPTVPNTIAKAAEFVSWKLMHSAMSVFCALIAAIPNGVMCV